MTLQELDKRLSSAKTAKDIFGELTENNIKIVYRELIKVCHVDNQPLHLKPLAEEVFKKLVNWKERAENKEPPTPKFVPINMKSKKYEYTLTGIDRTTDVYTIYRGEANRGSVEFKVVNNPRDNDLALAEEMALKTSSAYMPMLIESFLIRNKKTVRVVATTKPRGFTLQDVIDAYPNGLDTRDFAWMFNRVLEGLYFIHKKDIIHGAVVPSNIILNSDNHSGMLIEWCYSTKRDDKVKAIVARYKDIYAPEIVAKIPATPAADVYMAARSFSRLINKETPTEVVNLFNSITIPSPKFRPQSVGNIREEFGEILKILYGEPKFRHFTLGGPNGR